MTSKVPTTTPRPLAGSHRVAGAYVILLGLVCSVVGLAFDGGFVKGLFIGATVALTVIGAYVVGASTWRGRRTEQDLREGEHWLPSRDDSSDLRDR
jgi:O-antigen/teichoic acid export membrane protein